ncbi:MAG TPA: BPL-N domain-containing protein [Bacteriovoracaceae bacterium]|nr:BPL-N domain-containing protein [Bacteriovoracaceae bacterium]
MFKLLLCLLISSPLYAQTLKPKALVYGGPGACQEDCVTGAVESARLAGFTPVLVYPETFQASDLKDAKVWIQPGGKSSQAAKAMGSTMLGQIKAFVKNGGGYVGYCAGAFLTTAKIGTTGNTGLGIVPGRTILYNARDYITMENMELKNSAGVVSTKHIYWEGGPYFTFTPEEKKFVSVRGTYVRTGQIGAVRRNYYQGRIFVTGAHPEAPKWWRDSMNLIDRDGLDYDVTTDMIKWAARQI